MIGYFLQCMMDLSKPRRLISVRDAELWQFAGMTLGKAGVSADELERALLGWGRR